jgi:hypothetical protein
MAARAGPRYDFTNDGGLGVRVFLDVLPFLRSQLTFGALIEIAIGGIRAQPIAKQKRPIDFRTALRIYVQVDFRVQAFEHPMLEPIGLADTKCVAGGLKRRRVCTFIRRVSQNQDNIDHWLGGEPRHGCGAGVLDP